MDANRLVDDDLAKARETGDNLDELVIFSMDVVGLYPNLDIDVVGHIYCQRGDGRNRSEV